MKSQMWFKLALGVALATSMVGCDKEEQSEGAATENVAAEGGASPEGMEETPSNDGDTSSEETENEEGDDGSSIAETEGEDEPAEIESADI